MGGGGVFKKTDSGFGAGVRPTAGLMNSRDNLISQGRGARKAGWKNSDARSVNPHGRANRVGSMDINPWTGQATSGAGWGHGTALSDQWVPGQEGIDFIENENLARIASGYEYPSDKPTYGGAGRPSNPYTAADISEAQGRYDRAEERRQEKLDAMAGMAQGRGEGSQAPRPPGQGQPGQFQVKSTPMVDLRRRFPSLEQTEGSLNPFLGRRYNK